jgi:hypothetical protein
MSAVTCRITCKQCKRFVGVIRSDGSGPYLDECQNSPVICCPMMEWLKQFAPRRLRGYDLGWTASRFDSDAGGYQSIAIRALEDRE